MLKTVKEQVRGIIYLLTHPHQLKWIVIRETRYRGRKRNKQQWIEWQKFDAIAHLIMLSSQTEMLNSSKLNLERIKIFLEMVSAIGTGLSVLDIGCGDGVLSIPIWKMGHNVVSVELPIVAAQAKKYSIPQLVIGDAEQLAFPVSSFDVVLASEVIEHLWHPQSFLDEAYRVLKADGCLIIETPEGEKGLNYDSHRHYFTVERIKQMLKDRFILSEVKRLAATGSAQTPTIILLLRKSPLEKE